MCIFISRSFRALEVFQTFFSNLPFVFKTAGRQFVSSFFMQLQYHGWFWNTCCLVFCHNSLAGQAKNIGWLIESPRSLLVSSTNLIYQLSILFLTITASNLALFFTCVNKLAKRKGQINFAINFAALRIF